MSASLYQFDKELPPLPPEAYLNNNNQNNNNSNNNDGNNHLNSNKQHQYQQLQHHNSVHSQNSHHSHHSHNSYHQSNHSNSTINLSRTMSNGAGANNSNQSGQHNNPSRSSSSSLSSMMSSALPQSAGIRRNSTQTLNNFNTSNSNIQLNPDNNTNRTASLISSPLSPQFNDKIPTSTSTPTLTTAPSPQHQFYNSAGNRHSLLAGQHSQNSFQSGQDSASSSALPSPLPLSLSQKKKMLPKLILEPNKLNKTIIINQQSPAVDSIHTANNSPSPFLEQRSLNRRNLKKLTLSPMESSYNNNINDNNLSSSSTLFTGVTSANDSGLNISSASIDTPNSKNMSIGKSSGSLGNPKGLSLGNPKGLSLDLSGVNSSLTNTGVTSSSSEVAIENLTSNYFNYRDPERKASTDELIENIRNLELGLEYQIPIKADELVTLKKLGSGNSGSVSKVLHLPTQKTMARKIIHLETKEVIQSQIIRELRIMHECDSPFITGFYGSFLHEGDVVICMEYIDCGSLDKVFRLTGSFPEFILKHAAFSVLSGLNYLYDNHRIIHRDIKPSNILLDSKGNIKLCDFGVSRELISSMADTFVGTSTYMSPERIQGGVYSVKGDVWSLGLVLYELASGKFAFGGGGQIASACKNVHDDKDTNTITTLNTLNTTTSTNTSNSTSTAELDSNQVNGGSGGNGNSGVGKNQSSRGPDSILDLLQSIVNEKPPTLKTKDGFTPELCDFVDLCLRKEKDRPDPHTLMKHKFLADFVEADGNKITSKYRSHIKKWAKNVRRVQKGKTIK
ncbi:hypothetical protein B5S28_g458 [[Candida] boidinii]|nr:hypothetical protein B5S28_g458 [[Candida] boidinii]